MREKGVASAGCYDVGHVEACLRLAQEGVIELPAHFDFVMGVRGGIQCGRRGPTWFFHGLQASNRLYHSI